MGMEMEMEMAMAMGMGIMMRFESLTCSNLRRRCDFVCDSLRDIPYVESVESVRHI